MKHRKSDILWKVILEEGNSVLALLRNTDFSVAKIASVLNVSEAFVKKVKNESRIG